MNEVVLSPDAVDDLESICRYISDVLKNPVSADRIVRVIVSELERLAMSPESGPSLVSKTGFWTDMRYLVIERKNIAVYRNTGNRTEVMRIYNGRMDYIRDLFKTEELI